MPISQIDRRPAELLGALISRIIKHGAMRFLAHHMHRDGHPIDVEVSAQYIRIGDEEVFAAFSHPITERLQREKALRASEQKLRALFDKTAMCIGLLNPSGALRPEVAQTLVSLGIDLTALVTLSSLQSGLQHALRRPRR